MVVEEGGGVTLYDALGRPLAERAFSLGVDARDGGGVAEVIVWSGGLVARMRDNRLLQVDDFVAPRVRRLQDSAICGEVHRAACGSAAARAPPGTSAEVLVATGDALLVIDAARCEEKHVGASPVTRLAVAPNGAMIAVFTEDGTLVVVSADFENIGASSGRARRGTPAASAGVVRRRRGGAILGRDAAVGGPSGTHSTPTTSPRCYYLRDGARITSRRLSSAACSRCHGGRLPPAPPRPPRCCTMRSRTSTRAP